MKLPPWLWADIRDSLAKHLDAETVEAVMPQLRAELAAAPAPAPLQAAMDAVDALEALPAHPAGFPRLAPPFA